MTNFTPLDLPVLSFKQQILDSISAHQVTIICGETGSGKTTQIPQFIYKATCLPKGRIIVTQPRRVAATTLAKRVSEEMNVQLGKEVGYSIRFEDKSSYETRIKFMTDGMVLRELLGNPTLSRYTYVILDEAHERTLRTDILFGVLKRLLQGERKRDLKVIIMSATLNSSKFAEFFEDKETGKVASVVQVKGRTFPVRLYYTKEPQKDYLDATVITCFQIHQEMTKGDILAFLSGQEEIEAASKLLSENAKGLSPKHEKLLICPIYSSLPQAQQMEAFKPTPAGYRKIVLATNIAETSITIPGIKFVVDSGVVKQRSFDPATGIESLIIVPTSKSAANQRMGRAGRDSSGFCFRLYTEDFFENELLPDTFPEIERSNLANVILTMFAFGIADVMHFPYLDPPSIASLKRGLEDLYALEAIDNEGKLTELGAKMAEIPLVPQMSKALLKAHQNNVLDQVIDILSALSVETLFYSPFEQREAADAAKVPFIDASGDHIPLLNVMRAYLKYNHKSKSWSRDNCIHQRNMKNALDIRKQLQEFCNSKGMHVQQQEKIEVELVLKSILSGFFAQAALRHADGKFKAVLSNLPVNIHPSSVLMRKASKVDCIFFHEITFTSKTYLRAVSVIEPVWLAECAPKYFGNVSFQQNGATNGDSIA